MNIDLDVVKYSDSDIRQNKRNSTLADLKSELIFVPRMYFLLVSMKLENLTLQNLHWRILEKI